jgi:hypothetical protein
MAKDDGLSPDPSAPSPGEEAGRAIAGILGESGDADSVRLYLDLEFTKSYEIPREAVVKREKVAPAQSPFGVESSIVWVRPATVLKLRTSAARPVEHEFLAGDFTAYGSFTPVAGNITDNLVAITIRPFTRIETVCDTRNVRVCPASRVVNCPTLPSGCPVISECGPCRSDFVRCPIQSEACQTRLFCDEGGGFGGGDPFGF